MVPRAWTRLPLCVAIAALCLLGQAPLQAQPIGAAARAEIEALETSLRVEAIERVVSRLAARHTSVETGKADLLRARANPGEAFARSHLDSSVNDMLVDLFKADLETGRLSASDLKLDPLVKRMWKGGFRIKPVDTSAISPSGFEPPRTRGYPPEVAAIDPTAPHSMHDLRDYLTDRFTNSALDRIVGSDRVVELHVGTPTEAFSDLKNRGFTIAGEVKSPNGNYERLFIAEGPSGELRYVISGTVTGMDRVRHLSALLRFANGGGLPAERLEIVGDVEANREAALRSMRTGLERMSTAGGTTAIIGFRKSIEGVLTRRALARRGAEHLRDVLGADPYEGLKTKIAAERDTASGNVREKLGRLLAEVEGNEALRRGLSVEPGRVFGEAEAFEALEQAEKALNRLRGSFGSSSVLESLVADGALRLPGGGTAKGYGISRALDYGPLHADELKVTTRDGRSTLKLVSNYYGDTMSNVARALLETGHTRLAYFGTAGGTANDVRVGDIHVPERIYDFSNELASEGMRNGFLDYFEGRETSLGDRIRLGTRLGNVFSPTVETMAWLEDVRSRGLHSVEVENSYLAREVARFNAGGGRASLHTAVIVSDVPGSELTLGNNNGGAGSPTFGRMIDHYLDALGITDIDVLAKDAARAPNRPLARDPHRARALEIADRLIPNDPERASILRDRVAGIVGRLEMSDLESIDTSRPVRPEEVPGLSEDERRELRDEVRTGYTDSEVLTSVEKANAVVSRLARELARAHPNAAIEVRVGGGIERGEYSPVRGLTVEVRGDAAVRAGAAAALETARGSVPGAPPVRLGVPGEAAIALESATLASEPQPLVRELLDRTLAARGANHRGPGRVDYSGREHDPAAQPDELFSRYETEAVGPVATAPERAKFERLVARHGGRVEYIPSNDPRLRGGQGRTLLTADGAPLVLLPNDRPLRKFALLDELTHVNQIDRMIRELGAEGVRKLFSDARAGDPAAISRLLGWELRAKRLIRTTLSADDPNARLLTREIERLRSLQDPYLEARLPSGRLNWVKVSELARTHASGSASFLLGLFLKDLARVIESGDRRVIETFFDGLATTEFWSHYGLFVVGAEAGTVAYTKFLQRFVKPTFVNSILKSNVALATGMALPMLAHGQFDGRAYAINLSGLMLSSLAVKGGLAAIKWVIPLGSLERYGRVARFLKVARGVPGWIYAGVELAVVLYFAEGISGRINRWAERREARRDVARAAEAVFEAAHRGDTDAVTSSIEASALAYTSWRDRALRPAMEATATFNDSLRAAGREATFTGTGVSRFSDIADRYPNLRAGVDRVTRRSDAEVERRVDEAVRRFESDREEALRRAYHEGRRATPYDPRRDADAVSDNRAEAYEDEAALYEAAADEAASEAAAELLREWARVTREVLRKERALLDPAGSGGASAALEVVTR